MEGDSIEVEVNGAPMRLPEGCSISALIGRLALTGRLAVELNREIVPRSRYAATRLRAGDRVEVVQAIGGG